MLTTTLKKILVHLALMGRIYMMTLKVKHIPAKIYRFIVSGLSSTSLPNIHHCLVGPARTGTATLHHWDIALLPYHHHAPPTLSTLLFLYHTNPPLY